MHTQRANRVHHINATQHCVESGLVARERTLVEASRLRSVPADHSIIVRAGTRQPGQEKMLDWCSLEKEMVRL